MLPAACSLPLWPRQTRCLLGTPSQRPARMLHEQCREEPGLMHVASNGKFAAARMARLQLGPGPVAPAGGAAGHHCTQRHACRGPVAGSHLRDGTSSGPVPRQTPSNCPAVWRLQHMQEQQAGTSSCKGRPAGSPTKRSAQRSAHIQAGGALSIEQASASWHATQNMQHLTALGAAGSHRTTHRCAHHAHRHAPDRTPFVLTAS